jgi:uncharacterized membrane protein YphA (DoxX/SURF4 family)
MAKATMAEQAQQRQAGQIEDVRGSGIYPATGPRPPGQAIVRTPGALGHPEERQVAHLTSESLEKGALCAGRVILGGYFLYNGINHFVEHQALSEYARSKGVQAAGAAVAGSGLLILAGGLSILTGAWPKVGAGLISSFLLGVSPQMHAFWREQEPQQRMNEMTNFTKNMALIGASCLAAAHPEPWPWSVMFRERHMLPART